MNLERWEWRRILSVGNAVVSLPLTQRQTEVQDHMPIRDLRTHCYRVPTQAGPESDGTLTWDATTLVLVELDAGGKTGLGYTYADVATASLIREVLQAHVIGANVWLHGQLWAQLVASVRNLGQTGISSMAISAIDVALWDLRGKLLGAPVAALLGAVRDRVPIYGSGGFTSYDVTTLCGQLSSWVNAGITKVKMKVGRDAQADAKRVSAARKAIGHAAQLFVDANGAYTRKQALEMAAAFAAAGVSWFEEPVYQQDFEGLAALRDQLPAGMELASGEYGYELNYFARMLDMHTVDVLQADATRCGGFSGFLAVDGFCQTKFMPLSTHCAPYLHLQVAAAAKMLRHAEYFFDHERIERMFFDGPADPVDGVLTVDWSRPGIGLDFKASDAAQYALA